MRTISTFGNEIQLIRIEKKLSLKDVAKRGGLSHSYLSQIENKRRNPPKPSMIMKIAKGLNEDYNELMQLAGYLQKAEDIKQETEDLKSETEVIQETKQKLDSQLIEHKSLKKQEELIKAAETLSDLYQALTVDFDLYYKERLLTNEEKQKLVTVIEALLD